jgi:hypothetical protein
MVDKRIVENTYLAHAYVRVLIPAREANDYRSEIRLRRIGYFRAGYIR